LAKEEVDVNGQIRKNDPARNSAFLLEMPRGCLLMNAICLLTRAKIAVMFKNFSLEKVNETRAEIDPHLKTCPSCAAFLIAQFEKLKMEHEQK